MIVSASAAELVWVYRRGRRDLLDAWRRGECASEFSYGLIPLRDRFRVGFVEDEREHPSRRPWYPVERLIARRLGIGFALDLALRHLAVLNRARVVVSTVDTCGLPLALLKRAGLLRSRLLYVSQGLSDRIAAYGPDRRLARWCRSLLLGVDDLATLSDGAAAGLAAWLGVPGARVHVLPFGTDVEFWRPLPPSAAFAGTILSIGSDPGRDYATLLEAIDDLPLHVVTRQDLRVEPRPNVRVTTAHTPGELRSLYAAARFVVIPLHDRDQPGGQSAALQAMACGKAVVLTRTRGWWGEDRLRDGDNVVLVPPADTERLRQALRDLWAEADTCRAVGERARDTVERHFGEARFAEALAAIVSRHLDGAASAPIGGRTWALPCSVCGGGSAGGRTRSGIGVRPWKRRSRASR